MSDPGGLTTSSGLPIGAQLLGRRNDEETLLGLAAAVERDAGRWIRPPEPDA